MSTEKSTTRAVTKPMINNQITTSAIDIRLLEKYSIHSVSPYVPVLRAQIQNIQCRTWNLKSILKEEDLIKELK